MISDWTIIVVALIAAAAYLIPRMSTFVVNLRQLKKIGMLAESSWTPDVPEDTKTGPYV